MGFGDEVDASPKPVARSYSAQFNAYREREEAKARLAAWMNGREPRWRWEMCGEWRVLVMTFPGSVHDGDVYAAEHPTEYGRMLMWCERCRVADCGAAKWARATYLAMIKTERAAQRRGEYNTYSPPDRDLPF